MNSPELRASLDTVVSTLSKVNPVSLFHFIEVSFAKLDRPARELLIEKMIDSLNRDDGDPDIEDDDPAGGNIEDQGELEHPVCPHTYHAVDQREIRAKRGSFDVAKHYTDTDIRGL